MTEPAFQFMGGWHRDQPDKRDKFFLPKVSLALPSKVEFDWPWVYDQLALGSCTAQAVSFALQYIEAQQDQSAPPPARLAMYYWTRLMQGTVDYDSGASIRGTFRSVASYGICEEHLWKYDIARFRERPSDLATSVAKRHVLKDRWYGRVNQTLGDLKAALADNHPVVFGFTVYDSFAYHIKKDGIMKMPDLKVEKPLGGHAVTLVGYDDETRLFKVKNSWGRYWGRYGDCFMPYEFIEDPGFCSDFWTVWQVEPLS